MCQHWQKFLKITAGLSLSFHLSLTFVVNFDLKFFLARFKASYSFWFQPSVIFVTGEGQFGKVYACVNLDTGELMAVKQVCWP